METLAAIRSILLVTIVLALIGTSLELLFLGHFEDAPQLIPLGLIAAALAVLGWYSITRGRPSIRAFQVLMAMFVTLN